MNNDILVTSTPRTALGTTAVVYSAYSGQNVKLTVDLHTGLSSGIHGSSAVQRLTPSWRSAISLTCLCGIVTVCWYSGD